MRDVIVSKYHYPTLQSRLKTYLLKLTNLMDGEVWKFIADFEISRKSVSDLYDETWSIRILEGSWSGVQEIWLLKGLEEKK